MFPVAIISPGELSLDKTVFRLAFVNYLKFKEQSPEQSKSSPSKVFSGALMECQVDPRS